jgi:hypothetical protein
MPASSRKTRGEAAAIHKFNCEEPAVRQRHDFRISLPQR